MGTLKKKPTNNEIEINNLPDKESEELAIRMPTELEKKQMNRDNFNKKLEKIYIKIIRTEEYHRWNEKHCGRNE